MAKINIGTTRGNIVGVEIDKPFKDITLKDIHAKVIEKFGTTQAICVHGWADVTDYSQPNTQKDDTTGTSK